MRGFPSISPFLGPTRRRGGPPNKSDIIRWFTTRDNYTLLDKLGNDAPILPPVSVFDGVDGSVVVPYNKVSTINTLGDSVTARNGGYAQYIDADVWIKSNNGIGGNTTQQMLDRVDVDVIDNNNSGWCVVMGGLNDVKDSVGEPTISNLTSIYKKLKDANIKVVACTMSPFLAGTNAGYIAINSWILSHPENVDYIIDIHAALEDPSVQNKLNPIYDDGDGIHPNILGTQKIAETISTIVDFESPINYPLSELYFKASINLSSDNNSYQKIFQTKPTSTAQGSITVEWAPNGYLNLTYTPIGGSRIAVANIASGAIFDDLNHLFEIRYVDSEFTIYVDGIVTKIISVASGSVFDIDDLIIFYNGSTIYTEGRIWDIALNSYSIPLPHKGIGFDQNNEPVTLTVNGGVTEGYDSQGSLYMQDVGAVESNPELFVGFDILAGSWIFDGDNTYCTDGSQVSFQNATSTNQTIIGRSYYCTFNCNLDSGTLDVKGVGLHKRLTPSNNGFVSFNFIADSTNFIFTNYPDPNLTVGCISDISVTLATPDIIPNRPNGQPAYPLAEEDKFISGSLGRMNITPSYVRLYELGDVDLVKTFFDKSNDLIWKPSIQDLVSYRSESTGDWLTTELNMDFFYEYIQDDYKYQLWSKIQSGVFKDIFLYPTSLEGDNICKAKKYVGVGETYATIEDAVEFCDNDNLE